MTEVWRQIMGSTQPGVTNRDFFILSSSCDETGRARIEEAAGLVIAARPAITHSMTVGVRL